MISYADFVKNGNGDRILIGKYSSVKGSIIADRENNEAEFKTIGLYYQI